MGEFLSSFGEWRIVGWLLFTLIAFCWLFWQRRKFLNIQVSEITAQVLKEHSENPFERATHIADEVTRRAKESRFFTNIKYSIFALVAIVVISYVAFFLLRLPVSSSPAEWGQMGDFFGGMLNPILASASFVALLYTIQIQSEELRLTRREFGSSVKAQESSASALQKQLDESRKQYLMGQYHELFASISFKLDELLSKSNIGMNDNFKSYKMLLIDAFQLSLNVTSSTGSRGINPSRYSSPAIYKSKSSYGSKLLERDIRQLLGRLVHLMQEYAVQFGSTAVYRDYIFQFTETVAMMHYAEVINARLGDFQIFNIDEFFESTGFCVLDVVKKNR